MSESVPETALEKGIASARRGNRVLAKLHFSHAADEEPHNAVCWMWMAWVAETPAVAVQHLQRALEYEPGNFLFREGVRFFQLLDGQTPTAHPHTSGVNGSAHGSTVNGESFAGMMNRAPVERSDGEQNEDKQQKDGDSQDAGIEPRPARFAVSSSGVPPTGADFVDDEGSPNGGDEDTWNLIASEGAVEFSLIETEMAETTPGASDTPSAETSADDTIDARDEARPKLNPLQVFEEQGDWEVAPHVGLIDADEVYWKPIESEKLATLLVVDDSATIRKLVALTFEPLDYRVLTAADGVEAITIIGKQRPDLILLDINMPRMDGYKVCQLIRGHKETKNIPVVMLSGKDGLFDKVRGRLAGCTDYVTKPFQADVVVSKVRKYLASAVAAR